MLQEKANDIKNAGFLSAFVYFRKEYGMYIYNARIVTMNVNRDKIENGYIKIEDGIISEISVGSPSSIDLSADFDAKGGTVVPGFIDAHTHLGLSADGIGVEGDDFNEDSDPITPHLRVIDAINPMQSYFKDALNNGITAVAVSPGSTNPIGGQISVISTDGRRIDDMIISTTAIKFALGENPKGAFSDKDSSPITRMATASVIREALVKAQRYLAEVNTAEAEQEDPPEYDSKSEALIPLLKREIKAHFHCHQADDIFTAIRIAKEFNLDYALIHCTAGHLIADILGKEGTMAICGPIISDRCKPELKDFSPANAGVLAKNGVTVALCTDHAEIPIQYLPLSAALCVKNGMDYLDALAAITINPAKILAIDGKKGSLSVGKDADLSIWEGNPLDVMLSPIAVMVNGEFK